MANSTLSAFEPCAAFDALDHAAFVFGHRLLDHPALTLENLGRVIPALSSNQVFYSSGNLQKTDDFDRAHIDKCNGLSIEQTMERIRTSNSYIMVRQPESDPSFVEVQRMLLNDVSVIMKKCGVGRMPSDAMLYMFIASPNSVTPFHIDRYSTFLLQFRGHKTVTVFPNWDDRVVSSQERDAFMAYAGRPAYRNESESLGTAFDFAPGQALHIPFMAGHHVKNGADDVSVSLSIIFKTKKSRAWAKAMLMNQFLRRLKMKPTPVGRYWPLDAGKSLAYRSLTKAHLVAR